MKRILLSISIIISFTFAALPPQVQQAKDLKVMEDFIESHKKVSSTFKRIDIYSQEVYFGKDCVASFARKPSFHLPGWVGPASALVFKSSTCPID